MMVCSEGDNRDDLGDELQDFVGRRRRRAERKPQGANETNTVDGVGKEVEKQFPAPYRYPGRRSWLTRNCLVRAPNPPLVRCASRAFQELYPVQKTTALFVNIGHYFLRHRRNPVGRLHSTGFSVPIVYNALGATSRHASTSRPLSCV